MTVKKLQIKHINLKSVSILWSIVIFSVCILGVSAYLSYKSAKTSAESALKMQAMGMAITLESLFQTETIKTLQQNNKNFLMDIILNENWENVAFIAVYNEKGYILLHSNPDLIGKRLKDFTSFLNMKSPYFHYITLSTSERVFVADLKFYINKKPYFLRIALHTYPANIILQKAKLYIFFKLAGISGLVFFGIMGTLLLKKFEDIQLRVKELETLVMMIKILAHEIRNPLSSIKGFSQYLLSKIKDKTLEKPLKIIYNEALRIERLTDELLLYGNPVKLNLTKFNLKDLVEEVFWEFKERYPDISFFLNINQDFLVTSDRDKLKEILSNLIQNAVDAVLESSKKEKKIFLKVEKKKNLIKFEVEDNGEGMDEEVLARAMEPFFTTKAKGAGLGLAIVKKLCDALNIKVEIYSKKHKGTRVCLWMPESQ